MESKRSIKMTDKKAIIVDLIKEKRHILFGRCSETLTHQLKTDTWVNIYQTGCSMGILDASKGWRYLRDTVWQNWKKVSLGKAKNKKHSRSMSKRSKLNAVDKTVLEILGSESYAKKSAFNKLNHSDEALLRKMKTNIPSEGNKVPAAHEIESNTHHTCETITSMTKPKISREDAKPLTKEDIELKILKTKSELLERDVYMKGMEIYKKEKEFGLPMSEFTKQFYTDDLNRSEVVSNLDYDSVDIVFKVEEDQ